MTPQTSLTPKEDLLWQEALTEATTFRERHGHLLIPGAYICDDGFPLGRWLRQVRAQHRKQTLPAQQREALDALGMEWNASHARWWAILETAKDHLKRVRLSWRDF